VRPIATSVGTVTEVSQPLCRRPGQTQSALRGGPGGVHMGKPDAGFRRPSDMRAVMIAVIGLALAASGCSVGGHGEATCAFLVSYHGRTYRGSGVQVMPVEGSAAGVGTTAACDDGGGADPSRSIQVTRVVGVSPQIALMWAGHDTMVLIADGRSQPPALARLQRPVRCLSRDMPVTLTGSSAGMGASNGGAGDGPRFVELWVESASARRYRRARVLVEVPPQLAARLDQHHLRDALRPGATITVVADCDGSRYVARSLAPAS
jgi:hypothetical protein